MAFPLKEHAGAPIQRIAFTLVHIAFRWQLQVQQFTRCRHALIVADQALNAIDERWVLEL
jgi:hypothetical protein